MGEIWIYLGLYARRASPHQSMLVLRRVAREIRSFALIYVVVSTGRTIRYPRIIARIFKISIRSMLTVERSSSFPYTIQPNPNVRTHVSIRQAAWPGGRTGRHQCQPTAASLRGPSKSLSFFLLFGTISLVASAVTASTPPPPPHVLPPLLSPLLYSPPQASSLPSRRLPPSLRRLRRRCRHSRRRRFLSSRQTDERTIVAIRLLMF